MHKRIRLRPHLLACQRKIRPGEAHRESADHRVQSNLDGLVVEPPEIN